MVAQLTLTGSRANMARTREHPDEVSRDPFQQLCRPYHSEVSCYFSRLPTRLGKQGGNARVLTGQCAQE